MSHTFETQLGGKTLTIETGKLARLAGGAVTVRYGDTLVLGTANRSDPRPGLDFFPLTVEFEERMYAAGKIPGGFIKREARASEAATLAARLTDRPIRPLFPEGYKDDIQLVITVLSTDQENEADVLGTVAASAALTISEIPFAGPVGAVRIGRIGGEFVVNPTYSELADSELDLIVSGTRDAIMMVEAGAKLLPEDVMAEAILFGHRALQPLIDIQEQLREAVGKTKATPFIEAGTSSVLDFARHRRGRRRVRRRRHRDHGHRPEDGRSRRDRRGQGQGRQDHRPLVELRRPGSSDRRQPDARHHRQGRQGRPVGGRRRQAGHGLRGRRPDRRPLGRLRPGLHRGRPGRRHARRAGSLPGHPGHRSRGLSGSRELQARHAVELLRHRARRSRTGPCPTRRPRPTC